MARVETHYPHVEIDNPKVYADSATSQDARLFPYYAGYSSSFTTNLLRTLQLKKGSIILDPWNGSGTTTTSASNLGFTALGQDLNPVMVLVAKAALLPKSETESLIPLAKSLLESFCPPESSAWANDPLLTWLSPQSVTYIRRIEESINCALVSHQKYVQLTPHYSLSTTSSLAAFYYVSLFRATRRLLAGFVPTNPTWIKTPATPHHRLKPSEERVRAAFLSEVCLLSNRLSADLNKPERETNVAITLGSSEKIALNDHSVDAIVTSPPYCTRIDYAMATAIELAVLRSSTEEFDTIRRSLMGASTVSAQAPTVKPKWGKTCLQFLDQVYNHSSKASKTYYFKNHVQYFNSLNNSISELGRVLKNNGKCVLVVQNSYYKDVYNDVAGIAMEMAKNSGLSLRVRKDFTSNRSMAGINTHAKKYVSKRETTESVLCFSQT